MTDHTIDWSGISVQTCTCVCGTVFRAKAKFMVGKQLGLHTDRACPNCGLSCDIVQASSDPEVWTL